MPKHWSFKLSNADAALPIGSFEDFESAIGCLAPTVNLHRDIEEGARPCICYGCAGDAIQKLAVAYRNNSMLNEHAPRVKTVLDQVELVRFAAHQLGNALLGLDDFSREAFQKLSKAHAVLDLPLPAGFFEGDDDPDPGSDHETEWVKNLLGLAEAATYVSTEFRRARGIGESETADKGGKANLFGERNGVPFRNLVLLGWHTYEKFKPNKATGSEHAAFHVFLKFVVKYAVGKGPNTTLGRWVKQLAGPLRAKHDILDGHLAASLELQLLDETSLQDGSLGQRKQLQMRVDGAAKKLEMANRVIDRVKLSKKANQ